VIKICLLGNSHVGVVKLALEKWYARLLKNAEVQIDALVYFNFVGELTFDSGNIIAKTDEVANYINKEIGRPQIPVDDYDYIILYGNRLMANPQGWIDHIKDETSNNYSKACLEQSHIDDIEQSCSMKLLNEIEKQAYSLDKFIVLPAPVPSELHYEFKALATKPKQYIETVNQLYQSYFKKRGIAFQLLPNSLIAENGYSTSKRFRQLKEDDYMHLNKEGGRVVASGILQKLATLCNKPSLNVGPELDLSKIEFVSLGNDYRVKYQSLRFALVNKYGKTFDEKHFHNALYGRPNGYEVSEECFFDTVISPPESIIIAARSKTEDIFKRENLIINKNGIVVDTHTNIMHYHAFEKTDGKVSKQTIDENYEVVKAKVHASHHVLQSLQDTSKTIVFIRKCSTTHALGEMVKALRDAVGVKNFHILAVLHHEGFTECVESTKDYTIYKLNNKIDKAEMRQWEGDDVRWSNLLDDFLSLHLTTAP
jgi:hypothetical protein